MKIFKLIRVFTGLVFLLVLLDMTSFAQENKSFLNAPKVIKNPSLTANYAPGNRKFSGIPSLAVSRGGRLWAIWYTGNTPGEDQNNYVVVATSNDRGQSWEEVLAIDPDGEGPVRAYDPEVWIDPDGRLWIFWAQTIGHDGTIAGVWSIKADNPDNTNPVWSEPRRLTNGIMMCKPTVLSDGKWVLPASTWRLTDRSARVIISEDKGLTWKEIGAVAVPADVREFDEHIIVEKSDGTLWMLVRTKYGIGESTSQDEGKTWGPLVPSRFKHPSARFFIKRLKSGSLLLVKHGPIDIQTGRSHLMAFISKDDGKTWSGGLLLDERPGVSYPDGQQADDGTIFIIYDYDRTGNQNILMTSFREDDIIPCSDIKMVEVFNRRRIVSKGGSK
jgi:hypothetical protein